MKQKKSKPKDSTGSTIKNGADNHFIDKDLYQDELYRLAKFPEENPNPVLRISRENTVLYVNEAGRQIIRKWRTAIGGIVPEDIRDIVKETLDRRATRMFEIECDNRVYSCHFVPVAKENYVNVYGSDVSEMRKVEDQLRQSEEKYRLIFETANEGIWITDKDRKTLFLNQRMADMLGYDTEEIIGKTPSEFLCEDQEPVRKETGQKLSKGARISQEFKFQRKDGSVLWAISNASPVHDAEGRYLRTISMLTDITDRKRAEEKLKKSEQLYRAIGESIDFGVWVCEPDGRNIYASESYLKLVGMTQEQCSDFGWGDALHPDDSEKTITAWKECVRTGGKWDIEHRFKGVDGIWHPILARGVPIHDENGNVICWAGINLDISGLKQAEEILKTTQKILSIVLENSKIGTWELNLHSGEMLIHERAKSILGIEPETQIRTLRDFESIIHEEDIRHVRKAISKIIGDPAPLDTTFRLKSDKRFIVIKASLIYNGDGKPVLISGICFDLSDVDKSSEPTLIKLNEDLLRSNRELENFAYLASHDLQEPLRMVASYTQLLAMQYKDALDDKAQDYIRFAVDGAKRMYDLINGLLDYSRIHTKGKPFTRVDTNSVLKNVIADLKLLIEEKNVVIKSDVLPVIFADEVQIAQLFQNLIANAIKFCSTTPKIIISSKSEGIHYLFSFRDNGIGIEPQYFDKIFRIFQRLLPKEQYEGTGIGLAICKRIVERHDGNIWLESKPGKGSTFYFTIPVNEIETSL